MFSKAQGETLVSPDVLLERIRNGDKQAEEALVSQYWRGLHYIVNRQTSDAELAADIAQDAFVVVITKARKGEIEKDGAKIYQLLSGRDPNKDQSYFLCQLSQEQLSKTLFPIMLCLPFEVLTVDYPKYKCCKS